MHVDGLTGNYRGLIFDMDGLLVNSERLYWQANIQAAAEEHLALPKDTYLRLNGASVAYTKQFFHHYFKSEAAQQFFVKRTDELMWQWTDAGKLKLQPGVQAALDYFQKLGLRMGIASSNYKKVIDHNLWVTGIRQYFDFCLSDVDLEKENVQPKPAPDIYLRAAAEINLPKDELLIFEDSSNGIEAAWRAGIEAVMIPDLKKPVPADFERASLIVPNFEKFLKLAK
ncbi:MAG: HAD family phosphatase [Lactobacillus sp.]|jgi:HAD superfamily hydrolase (TIGR01509 family)|nr:HAD family phosphatase [Lactobacillus sp.]